MNYDFLCKTPLFRGCTPQDLEEMLKNIPYYTKDYKKNEIIFHAGQKITSLGLILSGSVQVEKIDIVGSKSILGIFQKSEIFAESYACFNEQPIMVDVVARENSSIFFVNVQTLYSNSNNSKYNLILLQNLLRIASKKNQILSMRIFHTSPKTIRQKLFSYFAEQVKRQNSCHIMLPLDRQELADYLSIDRTALSKELGKLRDEGLIDFRKNDFTINVKDNMEEY